MFHLSLSDSSWGMTDYRCNWRFFNQALISSGSFAIGGYDMWSNLAGDRKGILLTISLVLVVSFIAFWALQHWRDAQTAATLTPEAALLAMQDAGFETENVQDISYYPGPMTTGERGIEFYTHVERETYHVLVVQYASSKEARQVTREINALNQRMEGGYAQALHRGSIILHVYPSDRDVAEALNDVLKGIE